MKKYVVTLTFEVRGDHTPEQIRDLAVAAAIQIDDPRDQNGDKVDFETWRLDYDVKEV